MAEGGSLNGPAGKTKPLPNGLLSLTITMLRFLFNL